MNTLTLQIASIPDKENIVSEIWFGDHQVAEIFSEDNTNIQIEIFSAPDDGAWSFDLDSFEKILLEAKKNLQN